MYRNSNMPPPPLPQKPVPPPHPQKHNKPCDKKKKFDFNSLKKNTCTSLNEVEHFLCDFNRFIKYIKLYNLLK